jgi:hypothetical protein
MDRPVLLSCPETLQPEAGHGEAARGMVAEHPRGTLPD